MKNWRLAMLAAVAAMSLQACDVQVHSGSTKVQPPQSTLPEDTQLHGQAAPAAPAPMDSTIAQAPVSAQAPVAAESAVLPALEPTVQAPADAASAAMPVPFPDTTAQAPALPDTAALGAAGAMPDAAVPATTSVAAPTELQRFFEANAPAARGEKSPARR